MDAQQSLVLMMSSAQFRIKDCSLIKKTRGTNIAVAASHIRITLYSVDSVD